MRKIILLLVVSILSAAVPLMAELKDEKSFNIVFTKKGKSRIGFYDPTKVTSSASTDDDMAKADAYDAARPAKVVFTLGQGSGTADAKASVGVFWHLFPEGLNPESYTIDVIFASDASDTASDDGMLSYNSNILNYDVSVDDMKVLTPDPFAPISGSNKTASGSTAPDSRHLMFSKDNVDSNGFLENHVLDLSINAEYATDDNQEGVKLGTYSGHIIMKLERV